VTAALAEARKINVPMAVTVVDNAGQLVAFERMDNTQTGSIGVSQDKAVSAAMFRRPTKAFQDAVEGGLPITVDGKIIGGIGVSGGSAEQDGGCAKAGADALAAK